ncbi:hypothetical protein MYK68_18600 [Gordonia sp. PP30]|uniref:hypothetical protein n=1 Tax=Gordonia sp. PP30 TaxID=2935861 RepID=UPI001FFE95DA|nr:hypothetical protein [Gordonia sp. PP30]UQE74695.1 hypothetical protein MYK68_18600 [Gordonia sp. PP30]
MTPIPTSDVPADADVIAARLLLVRIALDDSRVIDALDPDRTGLWARVVTADPTGAGLAAVRGEPEPPRLAQLRGAVDAALADLAPIPDPGNNTTSPAAQLLSETIETKCAEGRIRNATLSTSRRREALAAWLHHLEGVPDLTAVQLRCCLAVVLAEVEDRPAAVSAETIARTAAVTEDTAAAALRRLTRRGLLDLRRHPATGHLAHALPCNVPTQKGQRP